LGLLNKTHFYVRQLRDMKGSYEFDPKIITRKGMEIYCGCAAGRWRWRMPKSGDAAMMQVSGED